MDVVAHISVLCTTTILYYALSAVVSPPLLRWWRSGRVDRPDHLRKHSHDAVLGQLIHSSVVGFSSAFCLVLYWSDLKALGESWVPVAIAEISLAFWTTDLCSNLVRFPHKLLNDKPAAVHHVSGLFCLALALLYGGIALEMAMIRLLSQLSVVLLIFRLFLLDLGQSGTILYLLTFSAMIVVFFFTRIAVIPWYWLKMWEVVAMEGWSMPAFMGVVVLASLSIDGLNFFWLCQMVKIYWKYFPEKNFFKNSSICL